MGISQVGGQKISTEVPPTINQKITVANDSFVRATLSSKGESKSCFQSIIDFFSSILTAIKNFFCGESKGNSTKKTETKDSTKQSSSNEPSFMGGNSGANELSTSFSDQLPTGQILTNLDQSISELKTSSIQQYIDELKKVFNDEGSLQVSNFQPSKEVIQFLQLFDPNAFKPEILSAQFAACKNDPEKFTFLAFAYLQNTRGTVYQASQFIENLDWPSEELKNKMLPVLIRAALSKNMAFVWQTANIVLPDENGKVTFSSPYIGATNLLFDCVKVFGAGDFSEKPLPISPHFAKAVGLELRHNAAHVIHSMAIGETNRIGVQVEFAQRSECRFGAPMITPFLPYLKNLPGLISLKLQDIGISRPFEQTNGQFGFNDQDVDVLLAIGETNPHLYWLEVRNNLMSQAGTQRFIDARNEFLNENPPRLVTAKELLAIK